MPKYRPGTVVQAKHDFSSPHGHCLQLKIGEHVTIVRSKNKDDEWLAGKSAAGKVGFFPAVYVKVLSSDDDVEPARSTTTAAKAAAGAAAGAADVVLSEASKGVAKTASGREIASASANLSSAPKRGKAAPAKLKLTLDDSNSTSSSTSSISSTAASAAPAPAITALSSALAVLLAHAGWPRRI